MTGANFASVYRGYSGVYQRRECGYGNFCPTLNIAAFGLEKVFPIWMHWGYLPGYWPVRLRDSLLLIYTPLSQTAWRGEYHIIIVDNGRSEILAHPDHIKTLNCIRCGACMNTSCRSIAVVVVIHILISFPAYRYKFRYGARSGKVLHNLLPVRFVCLVPMYVHESRSGRVNL